MQWHKLVKVMIVGVGLLGSAMVLPAIAQPLRGELPGSLLIFPEFNILPPAVTQLRISDIQSPALGGTTRVHLNYICPPAGGRGAVGGSSGGVCAEVDGRRAVTFRGTTIINVETELGGLAGAPCQKGYVIAFVENPLQQPISANQLIGSYQISGTDIPDGAEAVQAIAVQSARLPGTQLGTIDATGELVLTFGLLATSDYSALPFIQFSDFQAVDVAAGRRTELIVLTPTIKSGLFNPAVQLGINWWNKFEDAHSTTRSFTCWAEWELESISGLFTAAGLTAITGGLEGAGPFAGYAYGSMRLRAVTAGTYSPAILGVIRETGPGPTLRKMYHLGLRSSTYNPDPSTAPPGP